MKIELSTEQDVKVLTVTEKLNDKDKYVLLAGIQNILESKAPILIVDLSQLIHAPESLIDEINHTLPYSDSVCVVFQKQGEFESIVDLIEKLKDPIFIYNQREKKLKFREKWLEKNISEKKQKLASLGNIDPVELLKKNTNLKRQIKEIENLIKIYQQIQPEPSAQISEGQKNIEQKIETLLIKEGWIV
ncbi:MAG: hypothetical protein CL678_12955 [Bdellovibrionaceae bacterium]|nr:hypothetical protein [Pseudobdellovibrionaceae bacterium]|tara:strand:- start:11872 stop:12438 length:567 start_codon:yes stop_codon:yes gene_type:complete